MYLSYRFFCVCGVWLDRFTAFSFYEMKIGVNSKSVNWILEIKLGQTFKLTWTNFTQIHLSD